MLRRISPAFAVIATAILVGGVAWAASSPSEVGIEQVDENVVNIAAGEAAMVALAVGDQLEIVEVTTNPGWSSEVEVPVGREVEASFRNGDDRIDFNAELEDGTVRVRIRDRASDSETETILQIDDDTSTTTPEDSSPSTSEPSSTSTTEGSTSTSEAGSTSTTTPHDATTTTIDDETTSTTIDDDDDDDDDDHETTSTTIDDDDDDDDDEDDDDHETTSTTIDDDDDDDDQTSAEDGTFVYPIGTGGSVTVVVSGGALSLGSVTPPAGWSYEVEKNESDRIRIEFNGGDDEEIEIDIRVREDGLEVEIDD